MLPFSETNVLGGTVSRCWPTACASTFKNHITGNRKTSPHKIYLNSFCLLQQFLVHNILEATNVIYLIIVIWLIQSQ